MSARKFGFSVRLVTVLAFVLLSIVGFGLLWKMAEGSIPFANESSYEVEFVTSDVKNLEDAGDVRIAGVEVGHVAERSVSDDGARVVLSLDSAVAPLHKGATVRVGLKSVIGASYVDIEDGDGAPLRSGSIVPSKAVEPAVDIDEVLQTLDPETRNALSGTVRSLGAATEGTKGDISRLVSGMGRLGKEGHTALGAIAAQSKDLKALTREATTLLKALDTGRGRIATVVEDVQTLTEATSGQGSKIKQTMRSLPGLLQSANTATGELSTLSKSLTPVAADLNRAAPDLNQSLSHLPQVSSDLRGLLPSLDKALQSAPATLDRVPSATRELRALLPEARVLLRDVNPMLSYLKPYGKDVGAMFASFGASMDLRLDNGIRPVRLAPIFNQGSVRGNPTSLLELDPLTWKNPFPEPGQAGNPEPYEGDYPRVRRK